MQNSWGSCVHQGEHTAPRRDIISTPGTQKKTMAEELSLGDLNV